MPRAESSGATLLTTDVAVYLGRPVQLSFGELAAERFCRPVDTAAAGTLPLRVSPSFDSGVASGLQ